MTKILARSLVTRLAACLDLVEAIDNTRFKLAKSDAPHALREKGKLLDAVCVANTTRLTEAIFAVAELDNKHDVGPTNQRIFGHQTEALKLFRSNMDWACFKEEQRRARKAKTVQAVAA